jgi:hypothetical protein
MSSQPFVLQCVLQCHPQRHQQCHQQRAQPRRRPAHKGITWCWRPPTPTRRSVFSLLALSILFVATACGPSRPIAPVRAPSTTEARSGDFDAEQTARLTRLQAVLAEPAPEDFSGGLLVRLAFDDVADLDLFVTDPLQESAYFANTPTRSGGRLLDDRRCSDPSPRVEVTALASTSMDAAKRRVPRATQKTKASTWFASKRGAASWNAEGC